MPTITLGMTADQTFFSHVLIFCIPIFHKAPMAIDEHSAEILKREVALVLKIKLFDKFFYQFKFLNCGFS